MRISKTEIVKHIEKASGKDSKKTKEARMPDKFKSIIHNIEPPSLSLKARLEKPNTDLLNNKQSSCTNVKRKI